MRKLCFAIIKVSFPTTETSYANTNTFAPAADDTLSLTGEPDPGSSTLGQFSITLYWSVDNK